MLNKFVSGLVFGAGFGVALVAVLFASSYMRFRVPAPVTVADGPSATVSSRPMPADDMPAFHELPIDERISKSSAIALARFELAPDGMRRAVISEFLKQEPSAEVGYAVGDEFFDGSYYPSEAPTRGDGMVIFFVGTPARPRQWSYYSGDRITGLGDMPIKLLRKKCEPAA